MVRFEGGEAVDADLVVGADGIWSLTRKAMFGVGEGEYQYAPHYEYVLPLLNRLFGMYADMSLQRRCWCWRLRAGISGSRCAGWPDEVCPRLPPSTLSESYQLTIISVVFGRNGFFGYGYASSAAEDHTKHGNTCVWWSTHSLKECPTDWRNIDLDAVNRDLKARHKDWNNKTVQNIVGSANVPHLWPTFTTPLLPSWSCPGAVLIGDAAHALQPSSGQGASMALEDSETLALLLAHHLKKDDVSGLRLAVKQYDELRIPRVAMIHKKSQEMASMKQDMNVAEEMIMYFFIWLMGKLELVLGIS